MQGIADIKKGLKCELDLSSVVFNFYFWHCLLHTKLENV